MATLKLDIVTFNNNESAAIQQLFDDIMSPPSSWSRQGRDRIVLRLGLTYVVRHISLLAQGNVVAATQLAESFASGQPSSDYVLFYGCAGSLDASYVGHVFLVEQVSYASLGTVTNVPVPTPAPGSTPVPGVTPSYEQVTLKNKWLCHTNPHDVDPLPSVNFRASKRNRLFSLAAATLLDVAHVVATDKVIHVAAAPAAPKPQQSGPPHAIYNKKEWTYSETLAFVKQQCTTMPILVEMESFGIGMLAKALKCEDRMVIIRVVTDDLENKEKLDQATGLLQGRIAVAIVLKAIIQTSGGSWI